MPQRSAGVLLYRRQDGQPEVLIVHPGGPFWSRRDLGAWSIPKGLVDSGEDEEAAARREFQEETGAALTGPLMLLGDFRQPGGKTVVAFVGAGDFDPAALSSNDFTIEWPPHSGRQQSFPEVDRAGWFSPEMARQKLLPGQVPILDALLVRLGRV